MAWTSKYAAKFTEPVADQMVAIVKRDIVAALAWASGGVTPPLQPFVEYDLALLPVANFPALLVAPQQESFDDESEQTRHQILRLFVSLAITNQDRNRLARDIQVYVRAVDAILNSSWELSVQDFYATNLPLPSPPYGSGSLSPGLPAGSLMRVFVEGHGYDEMRRTATSAFAMAATLAVIVELEET
jgi:hypothetical protein